MRLKYKLLISIVLLGSVLLLVGGFSFYSISKVSMTNQTLEVEEENARIISEAIENNLNELIRLTTTIASTNVIKNALIESNAEFSVFNETQLSNHIEDLNDSWVSAVDDEDPFVAERMENEVALFLKKQLEDNPGLFGEVFVTNEYGAMISTTGKLTTLAHLQKYWWQESFNEGEGIVYLDDRGFDESVEGYVLGIVVPIYDDNGLLIGIMKSNYNISHIFDNSIANNHDTNSSGEIYVVRTLGLIVDGGGLTPLSSSVNDDVKPYILDRTAMSIKTTIDGNSSFLTIAPILLTFDSDKIEFGGKYESVDHTDGNLGEGWSIVHIIDESEALVGLTSTLIQLSFVSFGILTLVAIAGWFIGGSLSKPIQELNTYIADVGEGKLIKKDIKVSEDEIGMLTGSFNKLIDNLNKTLISKEKLEVEKELTHKYLDELKLAGNIFENSIENAPVPIMIHAEDGSVLNISKAWTKLSKYTLQDIPTVFDWTRKAYGTGKNEVLAFIRSLYDHPDVLHDGEFTVKTKDGRKLNWDFNSGCIGKLPDGRAVAMSVAIDVTDRNLREKEINFLSYHDSLTGLYNRTYLEETIRRLDTPRQIPFSIIMGDVNGLKLTNDVFGHDEGDNLLRNVSIILNKISRSEDIVGRWGGDEFVILLPKTSDEEAHMITKRIIRAFEDIDDSYNIRGITPSISLGYGVKKNSDLDIFDALKIAETNMYKRKMLTKESMYSSVIASMKTALYERSHETEEHANRLYSTCLKVAKNFDLTADEFSDLELLCMLHDIGKIGIPDGILKFPGPLNEKQWEEMKKHSEIGYRIALATPELKTVANYILSHHEYFDGSGYPKGLIGKEIPLLDRILCVADSFDAMTNDRVYKKAISKDDAFIELKNCSGKQFDPEIVELFIVGNKTE